jgi:hypothetical protein
VLGLAARYRLFLSLSAIGQTSHAAGRRRKYGLLGLKQPDGSPARVSDFAFARHTFALPFLDERTFKLCHGIQHGEYQSRR